MIGSFFKTMKLLVLPFWLFSFSYSLPNVEFYFRTQHPEVRFHRKRLQAAKNDLQRQIKEFSLSNRVKFTDLSDRMEVYYQGHFVYVYIFLFMFFVYVFCLRFL